MTCPGDPGPRPYFIPAPETAKLVLDYTLYGGSVQNVFHFTKTGGWDGTSLLGLITAAGNAWSTSIGTKIFSGMVLARMRATDESTGGGAYAEQAVNFQGTEPAAIIPALNATFAIKFATAKKGRAYRGRYYFPTLPLSVVTNQQVHQDHAASLVTETADFFGQIETAMSGVAHVVTSYMLDCAWRTTAHSEPVTGYSYTDLAVDSQRRRLAGRGI